jgi:predicted transcriptional regulator
VYLAILESGKISPADLAERTRINRTTIYAVAKELLKKGVILEDTGKTTYLLARPPQELSVLVEREEQALHARRQLVDKAITALKPLAKNTRYAIPKITFVEEQDIERHLHKRNEAWAHSITDDDGIWWGFQDHTFVEHYGDWIEWSWRQPFQSTMELQLLTNESAAESVIQKKVIARRHVKFWKNDNPFSATTWVCGQYVVMIVTKERPHSLIEIDNPILAANLRSVFRELWRKEE